MNDGSIRVVLKVEPVNFDLKSETEQNAIIFAYQGFLNSLTFPIQIVVQSKRLDLEQYLVRLERRREEMTNDLLALQLESYVGFVRKLIDVANAMSKRFYVVISYAGLSKQSAVDAATSIFHKKSAGTTSLDQDTFMRFRAEALNRATTIAGGLSRMGAKSRLLDTQELIDLFYSAYNPDVTAEERLTENIADITAGVVGSTQPLAPAPSEPTT
jgi:hypothetical protein